MRILMLAPQPFMEPRGVPFSVYYHIKVLGLLGHTVDLVTYPHGNSIDMPGLTIHRIPSLFPIHEVKVGPSLAKFPLDILMFFVALYRLSRYRYEYIFTHEEASLLGVFFASLFKCKHLYYMHSDLSQQIVSSNFTQNVVLIALVQAVQKFLVRKADAVLAICPDIQRAAERMAPATPVYMIENVAVDEDLPSASSEDIQALRRQLNLKDGPVLLYTGTFESYQGIDIILKSVNKVLQQVPTAQYVLVGGRPEQIEKCRQLAKTLEVADAVQFVGKRPTEEMPQYMALADILLSPRSKGTNTPLKLYTYLRSGRPILATDILSHTQMLNANIAKLVPPTPEGLTSGTLELLKHPELALSLGKNAQQFAAEHYSWPVFLQKNRTMYNEFMGSVTNELAYSNY